MESKAQDSRRRIIDSAKRMFWRHGYSTTSPRQVMADSQVGQGSFYHHFPTKPELGREVIAANGRDLLDAVRGAVAGRASGFEKLAAFLRSANDALAGCMVGGFAYDAGVLAEPSLRQALEGAFDELVELLEAVVREGQRDGSLPTALDPKKTAAAAVALVEGAFVVARATGRQSAADDAAEGAVELLAAVSGGG